METDIILPSVVIICVLSAICYLDLETIPFYTGCKYSSIRCARYGKNIFYTLLSGKFQRFSD
jgi:hypothetical protein